MKLAGMRQLARLGLDEFELIHRVPREWFYFCSEYKSEGSEREGAYGKCSFSAPNTVELGFSLLRSARQTSQENVSQCFGLTHTIEAGDLDEFPTEDGLQPFVTVLVTRIGEVHGIISRGIYSRS